jgi:uncharacterized protein (DUF1800 family)
MRLVPFMLPFTPPFARPMPTPPGPSRPPAPAGIAKARAAVAAAALAGAAACLALAGLPGCAAPAQAAANRAAAPYAIPYATPHAASSAPPGALPAAPPADAAAALAASGPDPLVEADAMRAAPLDARRVDRITGGVDAALLQSVARLGYARWLQTQLHPAPAVLPAAVSARIAGLGIVQQPLVERVRADMEAHKAVKARSGDDEQKKAAQKAYQEDLTRQAREGAERWLLHAVNSPNQVQERMVWFWVNHFSIGQQKGNLRAFVGDYEAALRPHALGRFRDLLEASAFNPAMLRYLDNERNAAGRINENYAREIMELHTLGVDAGYSQADVQELARVLTGVGVRVEPGDARVRPALAAQYVHEGLFEFNPNRHDQGDKTLLGQPVRAGGLDEVRQVLDRLARAPATARHVSAQLAQYFIGDDPPPALVERLARRFLATDGDIAAVLETLFTAPEFDASLGTRFKDPWQYVVSATRLAYDGTPILDARPMLNALARLGEQPFGRPTPDGWPMTEAAWASPGQLTTRFDVARAIVGGNGAGNPNFFRAEGEPLPADVPRPRVQSAAWQRTHAPRASAATRETLADTLATRPADWAWAAIVSPEFMRN